VSHLMLARSLDCVCLFASIGKKVEIDGYSKGIFRHAHHQGVSTSYCTVLCSPPSCKLASMLSMNDALLSRVTGSRFPHSRCSAHSFLDCINIGSRHPSLALQESTNRDATLLPFFPFLLSTPIFQSLQPYKVLTK
jgi:hypothetical protein